MRTYSFSVPTDCVCQEPIVYTEVASTKRAAKREIISRISMRYHYDHSWIVKNLTEITEPLPPQVEPEVTLNAAKYLYSLTGETPSWDDAGSEITNVYRHYIHAYIEEQRKDLT